MTKKILVISDNHGNIANLKYVLSLYKEQLSMVIHCGDSEMSPEELSSLVDCPIHMVQGNCDIDTFSQDDIFEIGDHVAFLTHGHKYGVNWGEDELVEYAMEMGADLVFFGHVHYPVYQKFSEEGVTVFNPGSISQPRQNPPEPTFLILDLEENGTINPHFYRM